jgi:hypothetical protein
MDLLGSIPTLSRSNLLVLKGLRIEDFAERISIFDAKIPVKTDYPQQIQSFTEIPTKFTSAAEWSKIHSNRLCWECNLSVTSYPKFIPENPRFEGGIDVCDVRTHFCEWTCVARYVAREYPRERIADIMCTVCLFESKFSGRLRTVIPEGLSRTIMKSYCGNSGITSAQFREKNAAIFRDNDLTIFKIEQLPSRIVRAGREHRHEHK